MLLTRCPLTILELNVPGVFYRLAGLAPPGYLKMVSRKTNLCSHLAAPADAPTSNEGLTINLAMKGLWL